MPCNEKDRLAAELEHILDAFVEELQCSVNGSGDGTNLGDRLKVCRKELADHCRLHGC